MAHSTAVRWARGEQLWAAGDDSDWVLAVCTGAVGLRSSERMVAVVVRGEIAGEGTAVDAPRAASCVGLAAGKGRKLDRATLDRLLADDPAAVAPLLKVSAARTAALTRSLGLFGSAPVPRRLAAVLTDLAGRLGLPDARGTYVPLRLGRADLAALAGCRDETVVRHMRRWQKEGLVTTLKTGFVLHGSVGGAKLAEFAAGEA